MLTEQQRARQIADLRNMVEQLSDDHQLTAKLFNEFAKAIADVAERRDFGIRVAACMEQDALDFLLALGETARMVDRRSGKR